LYIGVTLASFQLIGNCPSDSEEWKQRKQSVVDPEIWNGGKKVEVGFGPQKIFEIF